MANSTQGFAILVFLVAFTCLSVALFEDGNILMLLLFLVGLGASLRALPEGQGDHGAAGK